ncbi:MAG TPA: hypothetical protein HA348_01230 [Thermoplasmata archaeon]|nr:hypothetical protein [Thermoplasmata archaeon]
MDKLIENYNDDLESHILKCKDKGYYIEAFALIEQLFEQVVMDFLNIQNTDQKFSENINLRSSIETLGLIGVIDKPLYSLYLKFKKRRNDLVHKVVFHLDKFENLQENELDRTIYNMIKSIKRFIIDKKLEDKYFKLKNS